VGIEEELPRMGVTYKLQILKIPTNLHLIVNWIYIEHLSEHFKNEWAVILELKAFHVMWWRAFTPFVWKSVAVAHAKLLRGNLIHKVYLKSI